MAFNYVFLLRFSNLIFPLNNLHVITHISAPSACTIFSYLELSFGLHMCVAYIFIAFYQFGVKLNKNVSCRLTRGITTYMFVNKENNKGYSI